MIQLYFITMVTLILSVMVFYSDYYGWKYVLLLKVRNAIESNSTITIISIVFVSIIMLLNIFLPISPGPILLGEFLVVLSLLIFLVYLIIILNSQSKKKEENKEDENLKRNGVNMMERTHSLIETHKRNIGIFITIITILHLLFPQGVLL